MLSQLPAETSFGETSSPRPTLPTRNNQTNSYNNEKQDHDRSSTPRPPPAYSNPPPVSSGPPVLTYAVALYAYKGADEGDLTLQANDRIAVHEYLNADWWKGQNERTGESGIFPQSYIRRDERAPPPPPPSDNNYGNMPVDVSQQPQKGKSTFGKIGGKLGNAALFGAGGKSLF
jgi:hypothetical protein